METKAGLFEPLLERAERYSKTTLKLVKLKVLDKTADVLASVVLRLLIGIVLGAFLLILSIAAALWLGEILGKSYYGFLMVAAFYGLVGIVCLASRSAIKTHIYHTIVARSLTDDQYKNE